jgi:pimeloyl-ACP methyl ester carboxylesterase
MERVEKSVPELSHAVSFVELATGVRVEYREQGRSDGVPVVFLHGVTDSWRSFEAVLPHLPPTIRAFAVSQRGHGNSGRPDAGYGYLEMSEDLRAFMDAMGLPDAVIVGHSMGSMVAQRFAVDHAARVRGLVLTGAFRSLYQHTAVSAFTAAVVANLTDPLDPAIVRDFQVSTLARPVAPEFVDAVVRESLKVPARVWRATFDAFLATPDFSHDLRAVSAPTLIIWGDADALALRSDQEALLAAFRHARLMTYEGGGHAVHWEQPGRFARDVAGFILRHCAANSAH